MLQNYIGEMRQRGSALLDVLKQKSVPYVLAAAGLTVGGCGVTNNPPEATLRDADTRQIVNPLVGHDLVNNGSSYDKLFLLSIDRNHLDQGGIERYVLDVRDDDGPDVLTANVYPVRSQTNPLNVRLFDGLHESDNIRWEFELENAGSSNPLGTYQILEGLASDGGVTITFAVYASVGRGSESLPPDNQDDDGTPLEILLNATFAEFVDNNNNPINTITDHDFRIQLFMPEELNGRIGEPSFETREYGNNACIHVESTTAPNQVDGGWEVKGVLGGTNCLSPYEVLEGSFGLNIGNGNVFINDSIEVELPN